MYLSKNTLPARLVRSLRIPKHSSHSPTTPNQTPTRSVRDDDDDANETLASIVEAEETVSEHCFDDFEEISRDEIPDDTVDFESRPTRRLPSRSKTVPEISPPFSLTSPISNQRPGRSKSVSYSLPPVSLSRTFSRASLRTLARRESTKSFRPSPHFPFTSKEPAGQTVLDFPVPPTHIPAVASPTQLIEPSPVDDSSSVFYDSDPFRRESRHSESSAVSFESKESCFGTVDPNNLPPSPPSTRASSPSTIAPSESRSTVFKRFASIRSSLRVARPKLGRLAARRSSDPCPDSIPKTIIQQPIDFRPLPEYIPEPFDLSFGFDEDSSSCFSEVLTLSTQTPSTTAVEEETERTPVSASKEPHFSSHLAVPFFKYECVNPLELTRSPSIYTTPELYSLSATPLPSSPAWLSRNIRGIENPQPELSPAPQTPLLDPSRTPTSPAPLFIPPPVPVGYVLPPVPQIVVSEEDCTRSLHPHPPSYRSRRSSTLRYRSISYSSLRDHSETWKSRSPTIVAHSPSSFLRRSHSFSPEVSPFIQDQSLLVDSVPKASSAPDLLSTPADHSSLLPPIDLFNSQQPPQPTNPHHQSSTSRHEFFIPTRRTPEAEDSLRFPQHILHTVITALLQEASYFSAEFTRMSFNNIGKPMETVDFGAEVDYSAYEWFKDPPPPRHAPSPVAAEPFVPQPGVIEQNEMFDFALGSAPNVLYARYKQYGQLGVLAWCSEFSELIDALKTLGFEGNMFVGTRTQALKACEEILQLHVDIKMQIIVMYLSSQVARLRRFLDGDRQWNDYPMVTFPLPH